MVLWAELYSSGWFGKISFRYFISGAFTEGRRFLVLAIVDDYSREFLALVTDTSLSGMRVTRELNQWLVRRGNPQTIVSDNGTELTSMIILKWRQQTDIEWYCENGAHEAINETMDSP